MTCFTAIENGCRGFLPLSAENVINCVHNETILWDRSVNGSEEENELA